MILLIDDIYWEEVSGTNEVQIIKKHEIQGLIIIKLWNDQGEPSVEVRNELLSRLSNFSRFHCTYYVLGIVLSSLYGFALFGQISLWDR